MAYLRVGYGRKNVFYVWGLFERGLSEGIQHLTCAEKHVTANNFMDNNSIEFQKVHYDPPYN